jgi:hypothetical protein
VRVRCTIRTALNGEVISAWVSSTFWRFFTPLTMRLTTRSITNRSTIRSTTATTMITITCTNFIA